jgi:exodeoxyribonuclease VII small subunit
MAARAKKPEETAGEGFEERLAALEALVRELESEGLTLEQSLARYQQGVAHVTACRALLDHAEKRLLELVERPGGTAVERPLKVGEQGLEPDLAAHDNDDDDADPGDDDGTDGRSEAHGRARR